MNQSWFPGADLRTRREELGLSVRDILEKTNIPAQTIHAIEKGDPEELPSPCYMVGFVRSYCEMLGLDAERYIDDYRSCVKPLQRYQLRREPADGATTPTWAANAATWAAICAVIALSWFSYSMLVRPNEERGVEAGTPSIDELTMPDAPIGAHR